MEGKKRVRTEKVAAIALAKVLGSGAEAARTLGLPPRTVQGWAQEGIDDPELRERVDDAVERAWQEIAVEAAGLVVNAAKMVNARLGKMYEANEHLKLTPTQLRDLTWTGGVWFDKLKMISAVSGEKEPSGEADRPRSFLLDMPEQRSA